MSVEKPNLQRVLSDGWRIISSNTLHFLALSSLFIFPISIFNLIYSLNSPQPPTPLHSGSDHGRFVSMQESGVPQIDKSQIITLLLYSLPQFLLNLCAVLSITNSVFHGFHNRPLKLSSSLKSIIPTFFPFLATKIAYVIIIAAILFAVGFLLGICFFVLALLGFSIEPNSTNFNVVVLVMLAAFLVLFVYLKVEWFLTDPIVVAESSKWGFAAFARSSSLVKGARGVVLLIVVLFWVLESVVWVLYAGFGSRSKAVGCGVVVKMIVHGAVFATLLVFSMAAKTVLFVYCKAFNGEVGLPMTDKLGEVYIQLPLDVEEGATV